MLVPNTHSGAVFIGPAFPGVKGGGSLLTIPVADSYVINTVRPLYCHKCFVFHDPRIVKSLLNKICSIEALAASQSTMNKQINKGIRTESAEFFTQQPHSSFKVCGIIEKLMKTPKFFRHPHCS